MNGAPLQIVGGRPRSIAGRPPPHDLDEEAAVLSAIMLKPAVLDEVRGVLESEDFYSPANQAIYRAILDVAAAGAPIDVVTVATRLHDQDRLPQVGGSAYLAQLVDATPAIAHVEAHAAVVVRKSRLRAVIREAQQIAAEGYFDVGDEDEWIAATERRFAAIVDRGTVEKSESEHIVEPTARVFAKYLGPSANPGQELVTTGFPDLDCMLALEPGTLVVIGARSGRGKSSLATQFAMHVGEKWGHALYFSSEMPSEQLALRSACMMAKVDSRLVRRGRIAQSDYHRLTDACNRLRNCTTWMNDRSGLDVLSLRAIARREVKRIERASGKRVRTITIDYLQRIKAGKAAPAGANREQQVAAIAFELKELAMELKVCVVVPAQLNADGDKRDDERPRVSDLRESKNIENEADEVILIHNPHYYARTMNENADLSKPEACEIIKGKGRSDGNGLTTLWFMPIWSRFESMSAADKEGERQRRERDGSSRARRKPHDS